MTEAIDIKEHEAAEDLFPEERSAMVDALFEANRLVAAAIDRLAIDRAGLDATTAEVLIRLAQSPTCGIRGVEIGERCQMTATRVSRLLDRAAADGLVRREPDPTDRRAQHIVLTDAGRDAAQRLGPLLDGVLETLVFETLSAEERETLTGLLARLGERARTMLDER